MDQDHFDRSRLPAYHDERGDLAPPWERFPEYERYTIGWRMGPGEDWLCLWHTFLDGLGPDYEVRLAYLRRHPPAPMSWADCVYHTLHPQSRDEEDKNGAAAERRAALRQLGLIASDVAYLTWLSHQQAVCWPWEGNGTPEVAARYRTRNLWFWSRQVVGLRSDPAWTPPPVPDRWRSCASPLKTGQIPPLDPDLGLLSLAQMLSAGRVVPPWQLGLTPDDFADSFNDDMGYVDAFRLWGMSAFDDREHIQRYLNAAEMPASWADWVAEQLLVE